MATTNYNLPTISGASPVAIVDDYNGLANATDAAIAGAVSTEKTRAMAAETELANGVSNALSTANNASVSATAAQTAAEKAQTTANTAVSDAATAQTAADAAAAASAAVTKLVNDTLTFDVLTKQSPDWGTGDFTVAMNKNETLYKVYGAAIIAENTTISRPDLVPGLSGTYGYKIDCKGKLKAGTEAYAIQSGGFYAIGPTDNVQKTYTNGMPFYVGTDGNIYILTGSSTATSSGGGRVILMPACIYVNANFGDTPTPVES